MPIPTHAKQIIPMTLMAITLAANLFAPSVSHAADPVDFEKQVLPILKKRCFKCHGPDRKNRKGRVFKAKSGLRLDGRSSIQAGGHSGDEIIVPGRPDDSLLIQLVSLPEDDDDIMPAKGAPLTSAQIALIRGWIEQGADFGAWRGADGAGSPTRKKATDAAPRPIRILKALGEGVKPLDPEKLAGLCGKLAQVKPVFPGSPLLEVSFISSEPKVDDNCINDLAAIASHVVYLNLGRTQITDAGMKVITQMTLLVRLDLHDTHITDAPLARTQWKELRSLNLNGTAVTDSSLLSIIDLPRLQSLYVWNTKMSEKGIAQLKTARPRLKVRHTLDLPKPGGSSDPPRRRGN